jgi:hypothetical protein
MTVADMVIGGTITSSPGLKRIAPSAATRPDVFEFTEIA